MAKKEPTIVEGLIGLALIGACGFGGWYYFWSGKPEAAPLIAETTLSDYIDMSPESRGSFVNAALLEIAPGAVDQAQWYRNCLGYNAPIKNETLKALEVLNWCDAERINAPDRFAQHFNNLEAEDHSATARNLCRDLVRRDLVAPASASFAVLDRDERHLGSWKYAVRGKVHSDNMFGVTFVFQFNCTLQFNGDGDVDDLGNWDVSEFALLPSQS